MAPPLSRRACLRLSAGAAWALLTGHAPYRNWDAYRKERLIVATSEADGTAVRLGGTVVRTLGERLPGSRAVLATAGSTLDVVKLLRSGQLEVAVLAGDDAFGAFAGLPESGGWPVPLTALAVLELSLLHLIVRGDSDVAAVGDLAGKTVGIGVPGTRPDLLLGRLLAVLGVEAAVKRTTVPVESAAVALRERSVDALAWLDTAPSGLVARVAGASRAGVRLLDQAAALPRLDAAHGPVYQRAVVPARAYAGVSAPVTVAAVPHLLVGLSRLTGEAAHDIAWALGAASLAGTPVPGHPGALEAAAGAAPSPAAPAPRP